MTIRSHRRRAVALVALVAIALLAPVVGRVAEAQTPTVRPICFPNEGPSFAGAPSASANYMSYFTDDFGAPRAGHTHEGNDIMSQRSKKMRRLVSPVNGTVIEIVYTGPVTYDPPGNGSPRNVTGGNRVVIRDDDGYAYVFIHMNNDTPGTDDGQALPQYVFAPNLDTGSRVTAGQFIGYLGDSGNAESLQPHNHFEIRDMRGSAANYPWWSNYPAINPRPSLLDALANPQRCTAQRFAPFLDMTEFLERQYLDFLNRSPDAASRNAWLDQINTDLISIPGVVSQMLGSPEFGARIAPVARLYKSFFLRVPDVPGLRGWVTAMTQGATLAQAAQGFAASSEFTDRYGTLDNGQYVDLVYQNVLERAPDQQGRNAWVAALDGGASRGQVMLGFSESNEFKSKSAKWVDVVLIYLAMLQRAPDGPGLRAWMEVADLTGLVNGLFYSPEYAGRINRLRTG